MRPLILTFGVLLFVVSCKKDKVTTPPMNSGGGGGCSDYQYIQRSDAGFDFVWAPLLGTSAIGSMFFPQSQYLYSYPRFNPNNDYEICYLKASSSSSNVNELWTYDFCNNIKTKVCGNVSYPVDWSVKNWLIFTGTDQHIYKVKPNGDSLIKLTTTGGFHNVGKWSPDGTKFWYDNSSSIQFICNENGTTITTFSANTFPIDWIDNNNLLVDLNQKFCSYNYVSSAISSPIHPFTFNLYGTHVFNRTQNSCFVANVYGQNTDPKFILKYNFSNGKIDTLKDYIYSFQPELNGINSKKNKLIVTLNRCNWRDSIKDWIYYRKNLAIMDPNGTNIRLLNLD